MPSIEQIIQALKLAPRYLVAVGIFCGIVLFINEQTAKTLGIFQFAQDYRHWLGIIFIASISLICIDGAIKIVTVVRDRIRRVKFKKTVVQSLHSLTEEEKQILRYYVAHKSKTNTLRTDDGIVNGLVAKGIIYRSASHGTLVEGFSHNISECAWDYLNINPNLLKGTTNTYRTDKEASSW